MDLHEQEKNAPEVERCAWSDDAHLALIKTISEDDNEWIQKEIEKDIAQLWKVNGGELWAVTRGEWDELVLCCVAGNGLHDFMPYLINQARKQGFKSMRCQTNRKGLIKMLERYGVRQREVVLELQL